MQLVRGKRGRGNRGFTLVEVMVVVVILGLLATVVGRNVLPLLFGSKIDKAKVDVRMLIETVELFQARTGKLPDDLEELVTPDEKGYVYLKQDNVPKDPWHNQYVLEEHPERDNAKIVRSYGPDGEPDTEDDITSNNLSGDEDEN